MDKLHELQKMQLIIYTIVYRRNLLQLSCNSFVQLDFNSCTTSLQLDLE
jgi:hypothetical protein